MNNKLPTKTVLLSALLLEVTGSAQAATIQVDLVNCHLGEHRYRHRWLFSRLWCRCAGVVITE